MHFGCVTNEKTDLQPFETKTHYHPNHMSKIKFISKTPAGPLGNFNYEYGCVCNNGKKQKNVKVSAANDHEGEMLAQSECDEKCGESKRGRKPEKTLAELRKERDIMFAEMLTAEGRTMADLAGIRSAGGFTLTATGNTIAYNNWRAITYARNYCGRNDNACGVYLNDPSKNLSDCAHFVSHCLHAGGITIKDPSTTLCPAGLAVRVTDVVSGLRKLADRFDNVKEIDFRDTIIGDYGFLRSFLVRLTHAFMICEPAANPDDYKLLAHTANRCCQKGEPRWFQDFATGFRITDA